VSDLHDRFQDWLIAGTEGEPPRDLAVHASGCGACLRMVATVDAIQAIEIDRAPMPPIAMVTGAGESRGRRYAVGAMAVALIWAGVAVGSGMFRQPEQGAVEVLASPGGGVLGGAPVATSTVQATASPRPSRSPTEAPTPSEPAATLGVAATAAPLPLPIPVPTPSAPPAPQPTSTPTPPASLTPTPTATISASPTDSPSVTPTSDPTESTSAAPSPSE
jgi:hypothetical protein